MYNVNNLVSWYNYILIKNNLKNLFSVRRAYAVTKRKDSEKKTRAII